MPNSLRWPTGSSVISGADRWRITSPLADASAANRAIIEAIQTIDMADLNSQLRRQRSPGQAYIHLLLAGRSTDTLWPLCALWTVISACSLQRHAARRSPTLAHPPERHPEPAMRHL